MLFSNFTEKARIAISEAHDAAAEMGHNTILAVNIFLWDLFERVAEWLLKCLRKTA